MEKSILIVDDHVGIRILMSEIFRRDGFDVKCAGNREEAKCIAEQCKPGIGIFDVNLGGCNGLDLLKEIKSNNPGMVPIVISASEYFDDLCLPAGIEVHYVKKPFDIGMLKAKVCELCG
ncbi:response regulator [Calorimonas adulescens]|uniref:Stage 0 sporulation protein A homolog n=1 Tax=Calorimonas adulescens TaxID=2606906 RepID=A0A5D8QFD6_9THEO|nr:response regulator [Calorimonas adulescens]TZE82909.1 response regulator [Calorimonas adulescens]